VQLRFSRGGSRAVEGEDDPHSRQQLHLTHPRLQPSRPSQPCWLGLMCLLATDARELLLLESWQDEGSSGSGSDDDDEELGSVIERLKAVLSVDEEVGVQLVSASGWVEGAVGWWWVVCLLVSKEPGVHPLTAAWQTGLRLVDLGRCSVKTSSSMIYFCPELCCLSHSAQGLCTDVRHPAEPTVFQCPAF